VDVTCGNVAGHPVLIVRGEIDMANVEELAVALRRPEVDLFVDLDEVDYIDSFGVRALAEAIVTRRAAGQRCAVVCSAGSAADLILRVAGIDDDLIAESRESAVARLTAGS
jgi:anti-anti-sigma factor